jgi:hypothetical protein
MRLLRTCTPCKSDNGTWVGRLEDIYSKERTGADILIAVTPCGKRVAAHVRRPKSPSQCAIIRQAVTSVMLIGLTPRYIIRGESFDGRRRSGRSRLHL